MKDSYKKRIERLIGSAEKAIDELDKIINQTIELEDLDPEKAKMAAQGKTEAMNASMLMIDKIEELETKLNPESDEQNTTKKQGQARRAAGPENRIKGPGL